MKHKHAIELLFRHHLYKHANDQCFVIQWVILIFPKVHNVYCTSKFQVRVSGQSPASQGGKKRTEGQRESSNAHPGTGPGLSLSLQTQEANKVVFSAIYSGDLIINSIYTQIIFL